MTSKIHALIKAPEPTQEKQPSLYTHCGILMYCEGNEEQGHTYEAAIVEHREDWKPIVTKDENDDDYWSVRIGSSANYTNTEMCLEVTDILESHLGENILKPGAYIYIPIVEPA